MKNSEVFLSIIVPVYNVENFIERCLDSVFCQLSNDCEIILVDDGSTDKSGKICDKYKELYPILCKVYHKDNQGAYPTRNFALDRAIGKWIWLIDPDDYIEPTAIADFRSIINSHPKVDIITSGFKRFGCNWTGDLENVFGEDQIIDGEKYLLAGYFNSYLWANVYRHSFLKENNLRFNDDLNSQGDWLFNIQAYIVANYIYMSGNHSYNYNKSNPTSTLSRHDEPHLLRNVDNSIKAIRAMQAICEQNKHKSVYKPLMERLSFTLSGFFYGMFSANIPIVLINKVIDDFRAEELYPIWKNSNKKSNLFIMFTNCRWLFIIICMLRNGLNKKVNINRFNR